MEKKLARGMKKQEIEKSMRNSIERMLWVKENEKRYLNMRINKEKKRIKKRVRW